MTADALAVKIEETVHTLVKRVLQSPNNMKGIRMKREYLIATIAVVCLCVLTSCATPTDVDKVTVVKDGQWWTSYDVALAESAKSGKPVLAYFTAGLTDPWGAPWDWKLNQEIFKEKAFKEWAEKNVVLLMLTYPHRGPQDEATKKVNAELARKYEIEGCPTIILMKSDGTQIGIMDYMWGGAQPWIAEAQRILDANK